MRSTFAVILLFITINIRQALAQNDTVRIGYIVDEQVSPFKESASPSLSAIKLALQNSPINFREYLYVDSNYWKCEESVLKIYSNKVCIKKIPIKLVSSSLKTSLDQFKDLRDEKLVHVIIGLPNSSMVSAIYSNGEPKVSLISSIATASEFTIKSRNKFHSPTEENNWLQAQRWFFRSTCPDIVRIEALIDWIEESKIKNALVLYGSNPYGEGLVNDFKLVNKLKNKIPTLIRSYSDVNGAGINNDSINKIENYIRENVDQIGSIVILGQSKDVSNSIKEIRKTSDAIPIYVVEPYISKSLGYFWGDDFNDVLALSAHTLWEGDFDLKQFAISYNNSNTDNVDLNEEKRVVPLAASFAYDATILLLEAIARSSQNKSKIKQNISLEDERNQIKYALDRAHFPYAIMSKGQITASHDVIAKFQRCYLRDNNIYLFTKIPPPTYSLWILLTLGGILGGLSKVVVYIWAKLNDKAMNNIFPNWQYIAGSLLSGVFGAIVLSLFWHTSLIHDLLPKFFDQFSLSQDSFKIGLIGGIIPNGIIGLIDRHK